jgi:hypothetical protein
VMNSGDFLGSLDWSDFAWREASATGDWSWPRADRNGRKVKERNSSFSGNDLCI